MSDSELVAFLDESKKPVRDRGSRRVGTGDFYVVVSAVVFRGDCDLLRASIRDLELAIGARLHYSDLTQDRRLEAVESLAAIPNWEAFIFENSVAKPASYNEAGLRRLALKAALRKLHGEIGVCDLTLETRSRATGEFRRLDDDDHRTLTRLRSRGEISADVRIRHTDKSEPLLVIPDFVAGARTDQLANKSFAEFPMLAHRVTEIVTY